MKDLFQSIEETWPGEPASVRGSETSIAAAKSVEPVTGALRKAVYEWIAARGEFGATDEEIADALCESLGVGVNSLRPRRIELTAAKYLRDSGKKRTTKSRRWAVVWSAVEVRK